MSDDSDPPELAKLIPNRTRSSITDDERRMLYEAAMAGHQLPLQVRRWKRQTVLVTTELGSLRWHDSKLVGLECPGCGHHTTPHQPGPLACDGCAGVFLVAPEP